MTKENAPVGSTHYKESRAFKGVIIYFKETNKGFQQYTTQLGWLRPTTKPINDIKPL